MLQFPLKFQKAADGEFSLQVFSKEVGGESRAAASCLQGVTCGGAITMPHAHAGLRTNNTLDLRMVRVQRHPGRENTVYSVTAGDQWNKLILESQS